MFLAIFNSSQKEQKVNKNIFCVSIQIINYIINANIYQIFLKYLDR